MIVPMRKVWRIRWKNVACSLLAIVWAAGCGSRHPEELHRGAHEVCSALSSSGASDRLDHQNKAAAVAALPAALKKTVKVGDAERSYRLFIPHGLDRSLPVPFVSVHHGYTMSDEIMEHLSSWKAVAQREQFVVAFARGADGDPWNVGEHVCGAGSFVAALTTQDDLGFIQAMLEASAAEQAIDRERVFVGGFSMGGYFANHVGCVGRAFVSAVAAHSAGTYDGPCAGKPIPVLIIHGDQDSLIRYSCGQQAHDTWVARNGCSHDTRCEPIEHGVCEWNQGCPRGQEVGMCTLREMNHGWAGAPYSGHWLFRNYGGGSEFADAAELMWRFFKQTQREPADSPVHTDGASAGNAPSTPAQ